ncbi:unknown protein (plasmid) [Synechocystis sp. PCC 6803]|uniref:Uncharacterized protein n=1 Tax=Synechocystis sp. (strain ATCC 27184 / PCC 6803 / Kazusa) TaxID=1111708 RepID=Q6ZE53_SYNY3|nr:hypothetical protein MYO_5400 [Synechocystis sp. PCC 6803]AVP91549.1 hypothetical protein C7I86_17400 [Synechocystis sp. IPPAS B-1465]MCW5242304.1 hypothetical protein [Synechocystis sp. PCC 6803]BAD02047.1 unknown protein [Synechocystis sp. PCC 6803]
MEGLQEESMSFPLVTVGSSGYESSLSSLINGTAAAQQPRLINCPALLEVQEAIRYASECILLFYPRLYPRYPKARCDGLCSSAGGRNFGDRQS